ncbi:hypothetical protein KSX_70880 [Ktedonospora formicarum]|uniref:Uncharacterized protein n=1 Tax=Ktedonospora formicarum TaxID=2778364 RepID=A0A8J3MV52_9CHLR|nr:hypothetical protein KSX_70880 [Ktedonospora formicarum]
MWYHVCLSTHAPRQKASFQHSFSHAYAVPMNERYCVLDVSHLMSPEVVQDLERLTRDLAEILGITI